ncbi:unnamed protein product [Adineta ricciae]|uniref:G-protein coupled receptors family 1 profile domain-containing protein n=1 Tax=Adineta ricciae TaxID=249248 RepID=A0A815JGV8_ADIRI|nr:unnamed protein product [Adineta ricciae]CAF1381895.1 unnamed protein product [Adineta ricciae]
MSKTNSSCLSWRLAGSSILLAAVICFTLNIRYLTWYQRQPSRNPLILSLFIVSLLVLLVSVPSVSIQLLSCRYFCGQTICRVEGFTSFLCGCLCMLTYMALSINRCLLFDQFDQQVFCRCAAILCWTISFIWTLVPVFNYLSSYVYEGLGFHCSINWYDQTQLNRFYILVSFIGIYFIPLIILISVNLILQHRVRNIYFHPALHYQCTSVVLRNEHRHLQGQTRIQIESIRKANDRKRLRVQYRFAQSILYLVGAYLFAWTPYSILALLQIFHVQFIFENGFYVTLSALIAKFSVILSPVIYLSIMRSHLLKRILFPR